MAQWEKGPCECFSHDCGTCAYACCCPCFATKDVAVNIGEEESTGWIYCLLFFLGVGPCVQGLVADNTAKKAGIDEGLPKAVFCSCCWGACYMCTILNESKRVAAAGGGAAPAGQQMQR